MCETDVELDRHNANASGRWSSRNEWRPQLSEGSNGSERRQLDPGTGLAFSRVADVGIDELTRHLTEMRTAYEADGVPSRSERVRLLSHMAEAVEENADSLGDLDARCTGKLLNHALVNARAGAAILRYYSELLDADADPYSRTLDPDQPGARQIVDRVPIGMAACILPWNFPLSQSCARLAMLLAAGNAAVFKGSELAQPPLLALEELACEVGIPRWAFSVVTGGPEIGQSLVDSPMVDAVCFTGGIPTGLAVAQSAARSLKRVILELGGKTPFTVFADADIDRALEASLDAAFGFQGQACNAGSMLLVEEPIFAEFLERLSARARGLRIGYQMDHSSQVGPMISAAQRERVANLVTEAVQAGARVHAGGQPVDDSGSGFFYEPTVLSNVPLTTRLAEEESFGPVVNVRSFAEEAEVVRCVNDSKYGLAATIWTSDEAKAERVRLALRTGQVYINTHGQVPRNAPWGGFRYSGIGRLYGTDGLYAFTEARQTYALESL